MTIIETKLYELVNLMADGLEIAQGGIDMGDASDYQKVLDTRWEFLEIAAETMFSFEGDPGGTHLQLIKVLDHNLGYLPAFTHDGVFNTFNSIFSADEKSIYANVFFSVPIVNEFIRVFACDITAEYQAPSTIVSGSRLSSPSSYGAKVLNAHSHDITSNNMGDYTLNSNSKPISLQLHGKRSTVSGHLAFDHNVGYPPSFFVAHINVNNFTGPSTTISAMNDTFGFSIADDTQITIRGAQAGLVGDYAVLILKDPIEVAS